MTRRRNLLHALFVRLYTFLLSLPLDEIFIVCTQLIAACEVSLPSPQILIVFSCCNLDITKFLHTQALQRNKHTRALEFLLQVLPFCCKLLVSLRLSFFCSCTSSLPSCSSSYAKYAFQTSAASRFPRVDC